MASPDTPADRAYVAMRLGQMDHQLDRAAKVMAAEMDLYRDDWSSRHAEQMRAHDARVQQMEADQAAWFTSRYDGQPTRPYAGPDAAGGNAGRGGEFATGITGDPGNLAGVASEVANSERFNAQVPHQFGQFAQVSPGGYRPSSVLTPFGRNPGGNGMSAGDAARRWADGSYMGSVIGTSVSSFEPAAMLRASGQDAQ